MVLLALAGCGGSDNDNGNDAGATNAATPRQTLAISAQQDFTPGVSYGQVGAYE
jgi:hypothetical protein